MTSDQQSQFAAMIADTLDDLKAQNITIIDVRDRTAITDFMIVATGTSSRHLKALSNYVESKIKENDGKVLGVEASDQWVLVDAAEAMVHIMTAEAREHYQLERLWQMPAEQGDHDSFLANAV